MNLSTMSYHSNSCNCNNVGKNTFSQCQLHHLRLPSGTHQSAKNNLSNENRKIEHVSADVVASADIDNFDPYTMHRQPHYQNTLISRQPAPSPLPLHAQSSTIIENLPGNLLLAMPGNKKQKIERVDVVQSYNQPYKKQKLEQAAGVKQLFGVDGIGARMAPFTACVFDPLNDQENEELFRNRKMHLLGDISVLLLEIESLLKMGEYCIEFMNKVKREKDEINDGWEVFKFQVNEENRLGKPFDTVNDFLKHWFHVCKKRQESSNRIEPCYMEKYTKKQSGQGQTRAQQEAALAKYKNLSYTDKAIYRAIAKEYFKKRGSTAAYTNADVGLSTIVRYKRILEHGPLCFQKYGGVTYNHAGSVRRVWWRDGESPAGGCPGPQHDISNAKQKL